VAPVYREFWAAEHPFVRQEGRAFTVSSKDFPLLRLQDEAHVSAVPAMPEQQDTVEPVAADGPQGEPSGYGPSAWAIIGVLSVLALLAVGGISLLAVKILSQSAAPSPAPRNATETMEGFCSDLRVGDAGAAYSLTTAHFRGQTSQHAFTAELVAQGSGPMQCTYKLLRSNGSTEYATMTVTRRKIPESWTITLAGSASSSWQVAGITHAKKAAIATK
jgi:hypothetical protein